ncbi:oxidoreductase [Alkalihalobacillus pseudalcaliphilus]|uniref:oxidoreductase n=1 Tax=Alkalihalobacillus pseudalcaliphilus TaxID=79884 RepID=UPI00069CE7C7|nr:oxidoreductase [Alkalihalobacillus pseudalcaliphilus]
MGTNQLLQAVKINDWELKSRVVMAPMTRGFANNDTGEVGLDILNYYKKRAKDGVGIIITEGINPSIRGKGTFGIPGLYTESQVKSWKSVTEAVHEEGGLIVAQLWHVGRLTHRDLTGGYPPQAPSPIKANGLVHRLRKPFEEPEEMSVNDINHVINEYALAARNAVKAGFDGVEVHAAHGYLIDQFNSSITNNRTDGYGVTSEGRLRFMREVLEAVVKEVGKEKTIVRFSEIKDDIPEFKWVDPVQNVKEFIRIFKEVNIEILHPSTNDFSQKITTNMTFHQLVRKYWDGVIIGVGKLDVETANEAIQEGTIDIAAFGRPLLANPDFVQKVKMGKGLNSYQSSIHLKRLN